MDTNTDSELPRQFLIDQGQVKLLQESQEAQKGSAIGKAEVLDTVRWLKEGGLLNEVIDGLKKNNLVKAKSDSNQNVTEITFDKDLKGYPKTEIKIDVDKFTLNNKSQPDLNKAAKTELTDFLHARVDADNRKTEHGSKALSKIERSALKTVEDALINSDLKSITAAFQKDPNNEKLWKRIQEEVHQEYSYPDPIVYGKDAQGKAFLAIIGSDERGGDNKTAILIPEKGTERAIPTENGIPKPEKGSTSILSLDEIMKVQAYNKKLALLSDMQSYRCEFDAHDRKDKQIGEVSWKKMAKQYNTYKTHLCEGGD